jgi:hypothetical protein
MKPNYRILRVLLVSGSLWFAACEREGPLSADPKIATREVTAWCPKGTSEAQAKKILRRRGFQLARLESDPAVNHLLIATCTRKNHTWLVGVVIVDAHVAACSVSVTNDS